jgi:hypothetical protein
VVTSRMPAFTHSSADAARKPNTKTVEQDAVSHFDALGAELRLVWNDAWLAERAAWRKLSEAERDRHAARTEARRRAERDAIRAAEAMK